MFLNMVTVLSFLTILLCNVQFSEPQIIPLIDYLQSWFQHHETPPHTTVRIIRPNVEERIYAAQKWVCTQEFTTQQKIDEKRPLLFFRLFAYSDGKNDISKKIQMNIPISTFVDHRNGDLNFYQMCSFLPTDVQENPPKPMDPIVQVITRPRMRVYSKRFGGYAPESAFTTELQNLSAILKKEGLPYLEEEMGPRAIHYNNIYDAPGKFWNRRNEVWLLAPVESEQ